VVRLVREYRAHGAFHVQSEVVLPDYERVIRAAVSPEVEAGEALRKWLVGEGHEIEPTHSVGVELINSIGAME